MNNKQENKAIIKEKAVFQWDVYVIWTVYNCQETFTGNIANENSRKALFFIIVLLQNVVLSYTSAIFI
jgi:hypothetical protein